MPGRKFLRMWLIENSQEVLCSVVSRVFQDKWEQLSFKSNILCVIVLCVIISYIIVLAQGFCTSGQTLESRLWEVNKQLEFLHKLAKNNEPVKEKRYQYIIKLEVS